jgi:hypothetical protein
MTSFCFRDPARIYEAKEARSCKGCKFEGSTRMFGQTINFCRKKKRHGMKCSQYALPETPTCTESQTDQEEAWPPTST